MAKKKAETSSKKSKANGKPKQGSLPGLEDRALAQLEAKAEEYAEVRDERMGLTEREGELNDELLALMKKHKKAEYHHGEVHCWVKATDEKVKVRIGEITQKQKRTESAQVSTVAKLEAEENPIEDVEELDSEESVDTEAMEA